MRLSKAVILQPHWRVGPLFGCPLKGIDTKPGGWQDEVIVNANSPRPGLTFAAIGRHFLNV
jgi:hypothetical protein